MPPKTRFYIGFRSKNLHPEKITEILRIEPSKAEVYTDLSSIKNGTSNYWELSTGYETEKDLPEQMAIIFNKIDSSIIQELIRNNQLTSIIQGWEKEKNSIDS